MGSYIDFLEDKLGRIKRGWKGTEEEGIQIVQYGNEPFEGCSVYSTLGLSGYYMRGYKGGKEIRHELFMISRNDFGEKNIPAILQQISQESIREKKAYMRGEYIKMKGEVFQGTKLTALYVSNPVYFEDDFWEYDNGKDVPIVNVWVFPIYEEEVSILDSEGWGYFEDKLESEDPDLLDFNRGAVSGRT